MIDFKRERNFGKESQLIDLLEVEKNKARQANAKLMKI
jgi:hypothetical protein